MDAMDILMRHEGFRGKPYRDTAGKMTVGFGRNLDDVGITRAEAGFMLENDMRAADTALRNLLGTAVVVGLAAPRYAALMSLAFNVGGAGLAGFRNLLDSVKSGDWERAGAEMLASKWAEQTGRRAQECASMMRTGQFIEV